MRRILIIWALVFPLLAVAANQRSTDKKDKPTETIVDALRRGDTIPVYQGVTIKLDLMNSILEPALSHGHNRSYEGAVSVRLKERYYPTLEGGYARAESGADGGQYSGKGGFFRVGIDLNGLKKHTKTWDALLIGVRIGTGLQNYRLTDVRLNDIADTRIDYPTVFRADCWGEVALGCQVNIVKGLIMGWSVRAKILFTGNPAGNGTESYYIPGFGYRQSINGGVNYYIGWKF